MFKTLWSLIIVSILIVGGVFFFQRGEKANPTEDPIYVPAQSLTYKDLVKVTSLKAGDLIASPLILRGEARGNWYFEASFPIRLFDANGNAVPLEPGYVTATEEWMTTNFVPFESSHTFTVPATSTGTLILQKDNPSGEPQFDDSFSIPVRFYP